jgi:hypothetical protein
MIVVRGTCTACWHHQMFSDVDSRLGRGTSLVTARQQELLSSAFLIRLKGS